jgi:hypothetical protein
MAKKITQDRLLYYEPNPDDNVLIPNEDISIFVELETMSKTRSMIRVNTVDGTGKIVNNGEKNGVINFIDGAKENKEQFLSTNYTVNDSDFDNDGDTLGIESIDIEFDTAYTPLVKIKFIDVRGQSILTKGNNSKYGVFFELPYPTFNLTVKGFYGRPVSYCLHLLKWNAKFNSNTGNFEIDAEFIGYTYAKLTDLLIGYIRATVQTEEGSKIFNKLKEEELAKGIEIKTIDEYLVDIDKISDEFEKLKSENENIKEVNTIDLIRDGLTSIRREITSLTTFMVGKGTTNFNNGSGVLGVDVTNIFEIDNNIIKTRKKIKEIVDDPESGLNIKIGITNLTISSTNLTSMIKLSGLKNSDFNTTESGVEAITQKTPNIYSIVDTTPITQLSKSVKNSLSNSNTDKELVVYDFRRIFVELNSIEGKLNTLESELRNKIGTDLANIAKTKLNFDPTIRNIIRIFTIHCEVFLKTLHKVSNDAVFGPNASDRLEVLNKVGLNEKNSDFKSTSPIYPWFEYREASNDEGFFETWVGSKINSDDTNKVNEVLFVEDLLDKLVQLGRIDEQSELTSNDDLDFYPVSVLDTFVSGNISENPYLTALTSQRDKTRTTPEELIRCLLLRGFLALGFNNENYGRQLASFMGELEAYNVFSAFGKMSFNKVNDLINSVRPRSSDIEIKIKETIDIGKTKFKRPILLDGEEDSFYTYNYIFDSSNGRAYLPINGGFDGEIFYENPSDNLNKLKSLSSINSLTDTYTFTNNISNSSVNGLDIIEDGSVFFKILEDGEYEGLSNRVNNGIELLGPDGAYRGLIALDSVIEEGSIYNNVYKNETLLTPNPYDGNLKAQEIFNIQYKDGSVENVLKAYWYVENRSSLTGLFSNENTVGGTYLTKLSNENELKKITDSTFENKDLLETNSLGNTRLSARIIPGKWGDQKNLMMDLVNEVDVNLIYTPYIEFSSTKEGGETNNGFSLFGSEFYNNQKLIEAKAFLFLHTFSWEGVIGKVGEDVSLFDKITNDENPTIKGLFNNYSSFIKAPKLWCAFIGGLIYRYELGELGEDIINFNDNLIPFQTDSSILPKHDEFLYSIDDAGIIDRSMFGMTFEPQDGNYAKLDKVIKNLPFKVISEFKRIFTSFVDREFLTIASELEVWNDTYGVSFNTLWDNLNELNSSSTSMVDNISKSSIRDIMGIRGNDVYKNYISVLPSTNPRDINNKEYKKLKQINLLLKPNTLVSNLINKLISSSYIIQNGAPRVFLDRTSFNDDKYTSIGVDKDDYNAYLEGFLTRFEKLSEDWEKNGNPEIDDIQQKIFNSIDDDLIKLTLYRSLGAIYNKWVAGTDDAITSECGFNTNIIDSFKFLDRSFNDIGDKFYINPTVVADLIRFNYNQSFFDIVNKILSDNNFNFIPLPSFVNFTKMDELVDMFTPFPYNDTLEDKIVGPAFICTYTGQLSTNLDLGDSYEHIDDGIYISEDSDGKITGIPEDFKGVDDDSLNIPMIGVSYGQQNQSFFKDIALDQREFTETSETLQVIENISNSGDKRKAASVGQNLMNIYQTRSYSAEVEMMGNAMIQPMMYFQLNNIPMFRGAYMILKVTHSIKANSMTTKFKGVRIKKPKTKLVDAPTLFMQLLGSLKSFGTANGISDGTVDSRDPFVVRVGSAATRGAKTSISCGVVTKSVNDFNTVLKLVIDYLEGSYCSGGLNCGSEASGETLWGLDRKNQSRPNDEFWALVDAKKNGTNGVGVFNARYPKPKDEPELFEIFSRVIKLDYERFKKNYFKSAPNVADIVETDGRLYFNMIYGVFNGAGFFKGYAQVLIIAYNQNNGITTDELTKVFVDERLGGAVNAFRLGTGGKKIGRGSMELIANTGIDIEKIVGLNC